MCSAQPSPPCEAQLRTAPSTLGWKFALPTISPQSTPTTTTPNIVTAAISGSAAPAARSARHSQMGHTLRLVEIIDKVHHRAERVITTIYREPLGVDDDDSEIPVSSVAPAVIIRNEERPGVVANLDVESLVEEASRVDTTVTLACAIGSYVPTGRALLHVADSHPGLDGQRLRDAVTLADERTIDQDPLYALRLLVDIGTRALSPAVNDPTTAVQTLDRIEAILELLANRRLDQGTIRDDHGTVRLIIPLPSWEDFLAVGLTEIRHYGTTSTQVMRRLRALLDDLIVDAPPSRRPALQEQLTYLDQTVARSWPEPAERELALGADRHGLGEPGAVRGPNRTPAAVPTSDVRDLSPTRKP